MLAVRRPRSRRPDGPGQYRGKQEPRLFAQRLVCLVTARLEERLGRKHFYCRRSCLASVLPYDPLRDAFTGVQLVVRVRATHVFPNCPRYIHRMLPAEASPCVPRPGIEPPVPA